MSALAVLPVRVKVKMPGVRPASVAVASVAATVIMMVSSLVSVTVALAGLPRRTSRAGQGEYDRLAHFLEGILDGVTVFVRRAGPAGITTLVPRVT